MKTRQQTVVVTGASGGIGRAVARAFGARGARVGLLARGEQGLAGAAHDVTAAGGTGLVLPVDVAESARALAECSENRSSDRSGGRVKGLLEGLRDRRRAVR